MTHKTQESSLAAAISQNGTSPIPFQTFVDVALDVHDPPSSNHIKTNTNLKIKNIEKCNPRSTKKLTFVCEHKCHPCPIDIPIFMSEQKSVTPDSTDDTLSVWEPTPKYLPTMESSQETLGPNKSTTPDFPFKEPILQPMVSPQTISIDDRNNLVTYLRNFKEDNFATRTFTQLGINPIAEPSKEQSNPQHSRDALDLLDFLSSYSRENFASRVLQSIISTTQTTNPIFLHLPKWQVPDCQKYVPDPGTQDFQTEDWKLPLVDTLMTPNQLTKDTIAWLHYIRHDPLASTRIHVFLTREEKYTKLLLRGCLHKWKNYLQHQAWLLNLIMDSPEQYPRKSIAISLRKIFSIWKHNHLYEMSWKPSLPKQENIKNVNAARVLLTQQQPLWTYLPTTPHPKSNSFLPDAQTLLRTEHPFILEDYHIQQERTERTILKQLHDKIRNNDNSLGKDLITTHILRLDAQVQKKPKPTDTTLTRIMQLCHSDENSWIQPALILTAQLGNNATKIKLMVDDGCCSANLISFNECRAQNLHFTSIDSSELPIRLMDANDNPLNIVGIVTGKIPLTCTSIAKQEVTYHFDENNEKTCIFVVKNLAVPFIIGLGFIRAYDFIVRPRYDVLYQGEHMFSVGRFKLPQKLPTLPSSMVGPIMHTPSFTSDMIDTLTKNDEFQIPLYDKKIMKALNVLPNKPAVPHKLKFSVYPLCDISIPPCCGKSFPIWIPQLPSKSTNNDLLLFTATLAQPEDDPFAFVIWEGILENSLNWTPSIFISNNSPIPLELTTNDRLGFVGILPPHPVFVLPVLDKDTPITTMNSSDTVKINDINSLAMPSDAPDHDLAFDDDDEGFVIDENGNSEQDPSTFKWTDIPVDPHRGQLTAEILYKNRPDNDSNKVFDVGDDDGDGNSSVGETRSVAYSSGGEDNDLDLEDAPWTHHDFVEPHLGFHTVDPINREFAATDEALMNILDTSPEGIPADRAPYFFRLLQRVRDVFTNSFHGPIWQGGEHEIHLKQDTPPIKSRSFRFSKEHMDVLKLLLEKWVKEGVCQPSKSAWGSPAFFVPKKEKGSWRFVVDYRELNKHTIPDRFPLPLIDDLFDQFSGDKIFSCFDCLSGFNQQSVHPNSRYLTAFTTPYGLFEMNRLSMGLTNGPATYSRGMTFMCQDLQGTKTYIDDVGIGSGSIPANEAESNLTGLDETDRDMRQGREDQPPDDWDLHYVRVKAFLHRCRDWNLRLNPKKCKIGAPQIEYLGYIISAAGLKPNPAKVAALETIKAPENVRDIRIFLGMINYYRSFIPDCAKLAVPLNKLLSKGQRFEWTSKHQYSFEELKRRLANDCLRNHFDSSKECDLYTDCSDFACGSVLSQKDETGQDKVIAYFSQTLSAAERNYSVYQKECLAILKSIKHFHQYLQGSHFTVYTDHYSLASVLTWKDPPPRISRWLQYFAEYTFTAKYKPGSTHYNADAMSRLESRYVKRDRSNEAVFVDGRACSEPETLPALSSWVRFIDFSEKDLPAQQEVQIRTPLGPVTACSVFASSCNPIDEDDDTHTASVCPTIPRNSRKARKRTRNRHRNQADLEDLDEKYDSNSLPIEDVYALIGRYYTDPDDEKDYLIMDIWFDEQIQTYVAFRVPLDGSVPNSEDIESGIFVDSILSILESQPIRFSPYRGKQALIDSDFREEAQAYVNKLVLETKQLRVEDVFLMEDEQGIHNLYRRTHNSNDSFELYQLIIPDTTNGTFVRQHLLYAYHEGSGHLHFNKLYFALRQRAWWPGMRNDCEDHARSCPICQARGTAQDRQLSRQPILNNPVAQVPFEVVSIDVLSMAKSKSGMAYILVAVDHFTKWVEAEAFASPPTAVQVNQFMMRHFYFRHGSPAVIMADNGSNLTANELNADLFRQMGSRIRNTTAYHPQANGLVERMNRPICDFLSQFCNQYEQSDWDSFLDATIHAINTSVSASTGFTPYFLCHGREAFRVIDHRLPSISKFKNMSYQEYSDKLQRVLIHANVVAHKTNDKARSLYSQPQVVRKLVSDSREMGGRSNHHRTFDEGDWVMIYQPTGLCRTAGLLHVRKLQKHWRGPFQIIGRINAVTYQVLVKNRGVPINLTRLKPYYMRNKYVQEPF